MLSASISATDSITDVLLKEYQYKNLIQILSNPNLALRNKWLNEINDESIYHMIDVFKTEPSAKDMLYRKIMCDIM
jgi:hypothetical protein